MSKLAVVAVGGNSLIIDSAHSSIPDQYAAVTATCRHIVSLIQKNYRVVITHGNGPQVGFVLLRSEIARKQLHPVPLDSCVADTQGAIGYSFQMALYNEFKRRRIDKTAATVITQVVVDRNDTAFKDPSKPIGQFYNKQEAEVRMTNDGWDMIEDAGRGWRRVVASPVPKDILEFEAIKDLLDRGVVVIAAGGGGIPVVRDVRGNLRGVAAVIDKDLAASLLATKLKADLFLISTAVDRVYLNFGKPNQKGLERVTLKEIKKYLKGDHFKKGSMLPKIQAIISYLEKGGKEALITDPVNIGAALEGRSGTYFTR